MNEQQKWKQLNSRTNAVWQASTSEHLTVDGQD
jgi:hypothetical protein